MLQNSILVLLSPEVAFSINIPFTSHPPQIDGSLEESWLSGECAKEFIQWRPAEGNSATEKFRYMYCRTSIICILLLTAMTRDLT